MADDEVVDEKNEDVDDVEEDGGDVDFEEELVESTDEVDSDEAEEEDDDEDAKDKPKGEDVAEDDDEADPDDVEEDLDTILRDRIAAGADEDDEEDEDDGSEQPKRTDGPAKPAEEFSCPECFLMVRRSQFSARRTDCPGGLDGEDCPMKQRFV